MSEFSGGIVDVPSVFLKNLKAIDKNLTCEYNKFSDRFLILENGHIIYTVSDRYPDNRELLIIRESDLKRKSMEKRLREAEEYAINYREKKEKDARENIRDMTKDSKIQLKRAYSRGNVGGKENSTFRRVTPNPKGKVF